MFEPSSGSSTSSNSSSSTLSSENSTQFAPAIGGLTTSMFENKMAGSASPDGVESTYPDRVESAYPDKVRLPYATTNELLHTVGSQKERKPIGTSPLVMILLVIALFLLAYYILGQVLEKESVAKETRDTRAENYKHGWRENNLFLPQLKNNEW